MNPVKPKGVIDSLTSGFSTLNQHLPLIALPIILDFFLWKIARLSPGPLIEQGLMGYRDLLLGSEATPAGLNPVQAQQLYQQVELAANVWKDSNILTLLGFQLPSLIKDGIQNTDQWLSGAIHGWGDLVFLGALLSLGGLFLTSLYLTPLALALLKSSTDGSSLLMHRVQTGWRRLVSFFGILIGLGLVSLLPLLILTFLTSMVSPALGQVVVFAFSALIIWVLFYLFFAQAAIFVSEASALQAMRLSFSVIRQNFWPSLFLILLVNLLVLGTRIIWTLVMQNPLGMVAAILGNAYIATGLTAGAMAFYQDRSHLLIAKAAESA